MENGEGIVQYKINHWNIEYIPASWNDSVQNPYDGKIDLLFPTQMTDERKETMGFSAAIGGYLPFYYYTNIDNPELLKELNCGMDQSIMQDTYQKETAHSYMEFIARAVKYQLAIIGDLLDIQRIESGKIELASVTKEKLRVFAAIIIYNLW